MKKTVSRCLLATTVVLGLACNSDDKAITIAPDELVARINNNAAPTIIDVRTPEEFASGHVPGAINMPVNDIANSIKNLNLKPADEIVVYCESGRRAKKAENTLKSKGFFEVRHLMGDMVQWRQSKLPCTGC
jgi:phage shock protein E